MMPRRLEHLASRAARPDIKLEYGEEAKTHKGRDSGETKRKTGMLEIEKDFVNPLLKDFQKWIISASLQGRTE